MKEQDSLKQTESTTPLPEVKKEEEEAMLASLKSESISFVPDQLEAIMARCHLEASVDPQNEKEVTSALQMEASSFVPDKLQDIMKACGVSNEMSAKDQEEVVRALEGETSRFVPNSLGAVKKTTGTYNPYLDQGALAAQEKIHNEGANVVPDVEAKIYQETGVKKHFSFGEYFRKHWIALSSGVAVAAAAIAVIAIVPNLAKQTSAGSTYISVTVTPASAIATTGMSGLQTAYDAATLGSANTYTPSWSYIADSNNVVNTFASDNYSAKLVGATIPDKTSAYDAAAALVTPSYNHGYLETKSTEYKNVISVQVYSSDSTYASKYESNFQSSLNAALLTKKIYATINFSVSDVSSSLSGLSDDEARSITRVSAALHEGITLDNVKKMPSEILKEMTTVIDDLEVAPLSSKALDAIKEGLAISYNDYYLKKPAATMSAAQFAQKQKEIIADAGALDWANNGNLDNVKNGLANNAYYVVGDSIQSANGRVWNTFQELRSYILAVSAESDDTYLNLLQGVDDLAKTVLTQNGALPDTGKPDAGGHDHGDGPTQNPDGWGNGGGDFHGPGGGDHM
jgi:hypothetical protein